MENERGADSVLFSLDRVAAMDAAPAAPAPQEEGSGLVDIQSMLAQAKPAAPQAPDDRESSGLVDMKALMASAESEVQAPDDGALLSAPLSIAPLPTSTPSPAPEATQPAIPSGLLMGAIIALLAAVGVLAWKVLGS